MFKTSILIFTIWASFIENNIPVDSTLLKSMLFGLNLNFS